MDIELAYVAYIEDLVEAKAQHKFDRFEAEVEAKAEHKREVISWAKVADNELYKRQVYEQRKNWALDAIELGLLERDEAHALAKLKFPL